MLFLRSPTYIGDKEAFTHNRTIGFTRKILQIAKVYFAFVFRAHSAWSVCRMRWEG